jgi:hypothetical protein
MVLLVSTAAAAAAASAAAATTAAAAAVALAVAVVPTVSVEATLSAVVLAPQSRARLWFFALRLQTQQFTLCSKQLSTVMLRMYSVLLLQLMLSKLAQDTRLNAA